MTFRAPEHEDLAAQENRIRRLHGSRRPGCEDTANARNKRARRNVIDRCPAFCTATACPDRGANETEVA